MSRCATQIAMVLVVLISGILIGSGTTLMLLRRRLVRAQQPAASAVVASTVAARMQREYDLTDEQAESVARSVRRRLDEAAQARRQFATRAGAAREGFLADMKDLLPPAKYDRLHDRFETRERRFRWFFGLPPSPPGGSPAVPLTDLGQE